MNGLGYARATYDFESDQQEYVSLLAGDIVLVLEEVDDSWLKGKNHNKVGYFPRTYVESVQLPRISHGQRIFLATRPFAGEEDGDLSFDDGDIIVGLQSMNSQWWQASLNGMTGIIPLTHVVELHPSDDGQLCNLWSAVPASHCVDTNSSTASGVVGSTVVADSDLTAQLDDELTFCRGDVIYVLEDLGDGFAIGQCNGAVGQFPLCFCTPTDPQTTGHLPSPERPQSINSVSKANSPSWKRSNSRTSSYTLANTRSQDCSVIPYCSTLYEFSSRTTDELSFGAGEIVHLISHFNDDWCYGELDGKCGLFPTSYVEIIVDCDVTCIDELQPGLEPETEAEVFTASETLSSSPMVGRNGSASELYGRLICDFVAVNVNEVDASEGETVTVLEHINDDWLQVRHDNGRVGLCPASYVELFGAEPKPTVTPDVRTLSVVKPKLPVKPKLLSTTTSRVVPSSDVDQTRKSPVLSNPPLLSASPVTTHTPQSSLDKAVSSPTSDTAKSLQRANTTTNTFPTSRQPPSRNLSLDELIQAQLTNSTPSSYAPAVSDIKPSNQIVTSDRPSAVTLNGIADVAGQSQWYNFAESEPVRTLTATRKPPPPPRPAPARPAPVPSVDSSKNGLDVTHSQRKRTSNLIEFSPEHSTAADLVPVQSLPPMSKEQQAEKSRQTREKVIAELYSTESDYCACLELCLATFYADAVPPASALSAEDAETLFGQVDDVVRLSKTLIDRLKTDAVGKPFDEQIVGKCFVDMKDDIQTVYAQYCRNHDCAIAVLEKYETSEEAINYINEMLTRMRQHMSVFDLGSVLIKPVQRILKYPLLLSELIKVTDESHIDKPHLVGAVTAVTEVAAAINESKRRKDLVRKYKRDATLTDRISRLSVHSTKKKKVPTATLR